MRCCAIPDRTLIYSRRVGPSVSVYVRTSNSIKCEAAALHISSLAQNRASMGA